MADLALPASRERCLHAPPGHTRERKETPLPTLYSLHLITVHLDGRTHRFHMENATRKECAARAAQRYGLDLDRCAPTTKGLRTTFQAQRRTDKAPCTITVQPDSPEDYGL